MKQYKEFSIEFITILIWMLAAVGFLFKMYCMYCEMTSHKHTYIDFGC